MSKITFEFDSENVDDITDVKTLIKAPEIRSVLFEISHNLRKKIEYKLDAGEYDAYEALDLCFKEISELLFENGINDDLYM